VFDEAEPRRTMRLVTVSPTKVGDVACERRAAAAAALDRLALLSRLRTKAFEAAREADGLGAVCGGGLDAALRRRNMDIVDQRLEA
jgi:hypothetical protein